MARPVLATAVLALVTVFVAPATGQAASRMTVRVSEERIVVRGGDARDYVVLAKWGHAECPGDPPCYMVSNGGSTNRVAALAPCVPFRRFPHTMEALCPRAGIARIAIFGGSGADYVDPQLDRLRVPLTVVAGPGKDYIEGAKRADVVAAGPGPDRVYAGRGADRIWGGPGRDRLYGESGDDTVYGGDEPDYVGGGIGSDLLFGGGGPDRIEGAAGIRPLRRRKRGRSRLVLRGSDRDSVERAGHDLPVAESSRSAPPH
jgi:hypothetical protein